MFIFQVDSTLITATDSSVIFVNGAAPCNVFWQVGSSATLGTGTDFIGTIMATASITMNTGANLEGRALARTAAVTLDTNQITDETCESTPTSTPTGDDTGDTGTETGGTGDLPNTGGGSTPMLAAAGYRDHRAGGRCRRPPSTAYGPFLSAGRILTLC